MYGDIVIIVSCSSSVRPPWPPHAERLNKRIKNNSVKDKKIKMQTFPFVLHFLPPKMFTRGVCAYVVFRSCIFPPCSRGGTANRIFMNVQQGKNNAI